MASRRRRTNADRARDERMRLYYTGRQLRWEVEIVQATTKLMRRVKR